MLHLLFNNIEFNYSFSVIAAVRTKSGGKFHKIMNVLNERIRIPLILLMYRPQHLVLIFNAREIVTIEEKKKN